MEDCCDNIFSKGKVYLFLLLETSKVLNWENPRKTGMIFLLTNFFLIMFSFSKINLISIFSYYFLLYIMFGITITQFSEKPQER